MKRICFALSSLLLFSLGCSYELPKADEEAPRRFEDIGDTSDLSNQEWDEGEIGEDQEEDKRSEDLHEDLVQIDQNEPDLLDQEDLGAEDLGPDQDEELSSLPTEPWQENFDDFGAEAEWVDTEPENSMVINNDLFQIRNVEANTIAMTTDHIGKNLHSHLADPAALNWTNYAYMGTIRRKEGNGVGVTFYSSYPHSNRYYRLRVTSDSSSWVLQPHKEENEERPRCDVAAAVRDGIYRFHIEVRTYTEVTEVKAKVWLADESKPIEWVVCQDRQEDRLKAGTIGLWSKLGGGWWDDLRVNPLYFQ